MNHTDDNDLQIENQINNALDSSIDDLHPDIRRKLNQARMRALQTKQSNSLFSSPILKTVGAVSLVALVVLMTLDTNQNEISSTNNIVELEKQLQSIEDAVPQKNILNAFELEEIELLEQLEFALWMAEENQLASL